MPGPSKQIRSNLVIMIIPGLEGDADELARSLSTEDAAAKEDHQDLLGSKREVSKWRTLRLLIS